LSVAKTKIEPTLEMVSYTQASYARVAKSN